MTGKLALTAVFALVFTIGVSAQDKLHYDQAGPFATAQLAADFANSLPQLNRIFAQFVCEYQEGAPTTAAYRVYYVTNPSTTEEQNFNWQTQEFSTIDSAVAFANSKNALARLSPCLNPTRNPAGTINTLFYIPNLLKKGFSYQIANETFPSAAKAAEWANDNLGSYPAPLLTVQFVPVFAVHSQTETSWRVIFISVPAENNAPRSLLWTAVENDAQGFPLYNDSALAALNAGAGIIAPAWSAANIRNRLVVFSVSEK